MLTQRNLSGFLTRLLEMQGRLSHTGPLLTISSYKLAQTEKYTLVPGWFVFIANIY